MNTNKKKLDIKSNKSVDANKLANSRENLKTNNGHEYKFDLKTLQEHKYLISDLFCHQSEHGPFFSYEDYQYIDKWLDASSKDIKKVLLILDEVIQDYKQKNKKYPRTLKTINKRMLCKIKID